MDNVFLEWKEMETLFLFTGDMIVQKIQGKLLQKSNINEFSKRATYKLNIQKSHCISIYQIIIYKNFKVLFKILSNMKYVWLSLTKDIKGLHTEKYKALLKESKYPSKWRGIPSIDWNTQYC